MIIARSPFRLPLGGGGTDLPPYYKKYGAELITSSINKYMYVFINKPAISDKFRLHYSQIEEVNNIGEISHDIIRESLKLFEIDHPLEITSMADLAAGTGMGSSSAFTVALIAGLTEYTKRSMTRVEIAEMACRVEIDIIGKPIGKQDQYASAMGGINTLIIDTRGNVVVHPVDIDAFNISCLENRLMMFYTGVQRNANEILYEQGNEINDDASAMHKIREIGHLIRKAIDRGDITELGDLMREHWCLKRKMSDKMTSDRLDSVYNRAIYHGAIGGKIMGAGGGGLFLFCSEDGSQKEIYNSMIEMGLVCIDFRFEFEGVKVITL